MVNILASIGVAWIIFTIVKHRKSSPLTTVRRGRDMSAALREHAMAETIKKKALAQYKLLTHTEEIETKVCFSDSYKLQSTNWDMPLFGREIEVTVPVSIDMTTDLDCMSVAFSAETNTARITLPGSKMFRVTPHISGIVDTSRIGFFRDKLSAEEERVIIAEAEENARHEAEESGIYLAANRNAKEKLTALVKAFGVAHVDITVK